MQHRMIHLLALASLGACTKAPTTTVAAPAVTREADQPAPAAPQANRPSSGDAGYRGIGDASVSAETIAKFAPTALAPELSRRIQTMLDVRGVSGGALTRSGKQMFFTWNITGAPQVWRQDGPGAYPIQLTGGEDRTMVAALAPNDAYLVVSRDIGGAENPGLYLLDIKGGPLTVIQHTPKVQASLQFISDDAAWVYYAANDVKPDTYTMYRWNVAQKTREVMFDQPGLWRIADHQGSGAKEAWLLTKALGNAQTEVYRYEPASKTLTPLLGQNEQEHYVVAFGAGDDVIVQTSKGAEFERLFTLRAGKLLPLTPELKHDVEGFDVDEPRKRIYYTVNEAGYYKAHALDAKTGKPIKLPSLGAADNTHFAGSSRDGRYAQFAQDSATFPARVVVFDWQRQTTTAWRTPSTPEVDPSAFAPATLESYPARDGTPIPMFVRRPDKCKSASCPVIVNFHGGPEGQSMAGWNATAQLYVDAGFIFVQPNVRGSTGYGKAWLHADDGAKRKQVITDIEDVAVHIRKAWAKDGVAPKVGVMGGSYGGYSTLMAMTYFAGAYDAGVSIVGISNLVSFIQNTAPYRRILRSSEYGDPEKGDRDVMQELSPTTHIEKLKAPLLVIQGVNDPRVPVGESVQMYEAMQGRQVPGGLILFADEGHGASKRSNQVLMIGHTLAFLQKHLGAN